MLHGICDTMGLLLKLSSGHRAGVQECLLILVIKCSGVIVRIDDSLNSVAKYSKYTLLEKNNE